MGDNPLRWRIERLTLERLVKVALLVMLPACMAMVLVLLVFLAVL